jgi:Asp-tRNA(Asn)/Glu-tRNA(Gln) amidotransferase B subunit
MIKKISILFALIFTIIASSSYVEARTKHPHKKKIASIKHKKSRHKRKTHAYRHGNGPDLKKITSDSDYQDESKNGVTPIETKQPAL